MNIQKEKIIELIKKYPVDAILNIQEKSSKYLEYNPLHDEISYTNDKSIWANLIIIKDNKKALYNIDWFSLEKLEEALNESLKFIDLAEFDTDIIIPEITDSSEKDFSDLELENIDFDFLEKEFNKFKNYKLNEKIIIEEFAIWVNFNTHYYINSLWAFKSQKDNASVIYIALFWENWELRETSYRYINSKKIPEISDDLIIELENELLNKIELSDNKIYSWIYDLTLDREVVSSFLEIIISNMWAESIREWISLFRNNKIWDLIFSPKFTLVNNPDLDWYTWNIVFDSEWVTAKKTVLFDKWILNAKFFDYKNAKKEWIENLGNSTISNIELIWEIDKDYLKKSDFIFTKLMAFHTVDSSTWKFALNWEWYILENWEKKDFVRWISLTWNIIDLFKNIKSIWDDFYDYWNFKIPSITFEKQQII